MVSSKLSIGTFIFHFNVIFESSKTLKFSRFYELSSEYYKIEGNHGAYYRNSLKYLGVVDLSKMDKETQQAKAFSLGISGLVFMRMSLLFFDRKIIT